MALRSVLSTHFTFHLSSRLCSSTAGCSLLSVPAIVFCQSLSCLTFHLGSVHHCRMQPFINAFHCPLFIAFLFHVVPSFDMSSRHVPLGRPLDLFPLFACRPVQRLAKLVSFILHSSHTSDIKGFLMCSLPGTWRYRVTVR